MLSQVVLLFIGVLISGGVERACSSSQYKVLIASSYGSPVDLTCESTDDPKIEVSGITLFKHASTVPAYNDYPGIEAQAKRECDATLRAPNATLPAGCRLAFAGLDIPSDVMVVVVFWCYSGSHGTQQDIIVTSTQDDLKVKCSHDNIIRIKDITVDNERPVDFLDLKSSCTEEMMNGYLPSHANGNKPAMCILHRQGRAGEMKATYRCESKPNSAKYHTLSDQSASRFAMPASS